ncbi:MAG: FAD:protein FMN transferase [Microbacteriaceae bacterium]
MTVTADPVPWRFDAIGTAWSVETPEPVGDDERAQVHALIARFDLAWSRFRDDSLVTRMSREAGRYRLPDEADALLGLYRDLHEATGGRMSPLVGRTLETLGYDRDYRLIPAAAPAPVPAWEDTLAWDGTHLTLLTPALLDVGAAGKGLLVDLVSDLLAELGHPDSVVDASGDLRIRGRGTGGRLPERIALEHPRDPRKAIGVARLGVGALAASASNRRAWRDVHHVLDGITGLPTRDVIATWAIADSALAADGLATALFFTSGEDLSGVYSFEWVRMFRDGRAQSSPGFDGELFT